MWTNIWNISQLQSLTEKTSDFTSYRRQQISAIRQILVDCCVLLTVVTRYLPTPPSQSDNGYNASRTAPRISSAHSHVHTRATPLLRNLHCLPVEKRIVYKLCVLMFDVKYGSAPAYLADLCNVCTDERLHSTGCGDFVIPRTRTRTAYSAFMVTAPSAWNARPSDLRTVTSKSTFHNRLKTYLFSSYITYCEPSTVVNIVTVNRALTFYMDSTYSALTVYELLLY